MKDYTLPIRFIELQEVRYNAQWARNGVYKPGVTHTRILPMRFIPIVLFRIMAHEFTDCRRDGITLDCAACSVWTM